MSDFLDLFGVMMAVMLPVSLIVFITEYFKYKKSTESQLGTLRKEMDLNSTKELQDEVVLLRERVEVLERIVTDSSYEVERKIQGL
ncbi:MAG: hypothetical protein COB20_04815 [SAR86 cluster bacterium]|uniref:Phage shock protein B n=1 Tax=SAR86 cluster bacterium TaxID=2030880 RepID=A0A2A4X9U8_9GAMM|nr:MAG: hypothetical protein COB20_04815 [SAR86 cluster bacterium]